MVNVGFVGAGGIAETHATALGKVDGARLAAVTDIIPERAIKLAGVFGAVPVPGLEELLRFPGLDVIYILTPPAFHASQVIAAIQAGIPVMCEKPLTLTLREADEVVQAARETGIPVMTGFTHRYHPLAARARALLLEGDLGELVSIWSHRMILLPVEAGSWLANRELSGGVALQYAIHDLDWECWLGGAVKQVYGQEHHTNPQIDIEDNLWALIRFQSGGSGSVGVSWTTPSAHTERGVIGSRGNLRIIDQKQLSGITAGNQKVEVDLGNDYDWLDVFVRQNRDIVERVSKGLPFAISAQDGRDSLEVSLAVQRSAAEGRLVKLPLEYQ